MENTELRARLWMWGPFILAGLLFAVAVFSVFSLLNGTNASDSDAVSEVSEQSIAALISSPENLRRSYLAANGGEELLAGLRSSRSRGILETPAAPVPFLSVKRRPGQSLLRLQFPSYEQSFVVDNDVVWQRFTRDDREPLFVLLKGDDATRIRRLGAFFDPVMALFLLNEGRINEIKTEVFREQTAIVVDFENEELKLGSKAYIDPLSMYLIFRADTLPDGGERTFSYSNHQEVGGVLIPFLIESALNGTFENRVIVETSEHNVGIYSDYFEYPADQQE